MIIFATNHDPSTADSFRIATSIATTNDTVLFGNDAVRTKLLTVLKDKPTASVMCFSHGKEDAWVGNNADNALTINDLELFKTRKMFAYACSTAKELGKKASEQAGCFYWGYNDTILARDNNNNVQLKPIFEYIKTAFPLCENREKIQLFFQNLQTFCDAETEEYLGQYPEEEDNDCIAAHQLLRDIWAKLECHTDNQQYSHPESVEPLLY